MRTTVNLDDDISAAAERVRKEEGVSLSEAVNAIARAGLPRVSSAPRQFRQRTAALGLTVDVSNVHEALDLLDGTDRR